MKVRGRRECKACGHQWSYYDTGSVACPACDSLRSVGVDERTRHTASATTLDLSEHRAAVGDGDGDAADLAGETDAIKSTVREYVRRRGFIHAGDLQPLDETFLAAHELLHATDVYARERNPTDDEELYLVSLLNGADSGDRPAPDHVPPSMAAARGLGYADAVRDYRRDVATYLDDEPDPVARRLLGRLTDRMKRVRALEGDVPVEESESLARATQELSSYLTTGDESAVAAATDRLDRLDDLD
ncbi:hypothetical protein ACFO0N_13800 [Halobium salinum]|uniref:TFIIB-type zinc ribbon-containing protein n=1 Tax=Halobium salinum TaxID=1364940 RepID=A0ABD5PE10_9EURY|nr:hypothetical protein [Halobium salinum]